MKGRQGQDESKDKTRARVTKVKKVLKREANRSGYDISAKREETEKQVS